MTLCKGETGLTPDFLPLFPLAGALLLPGGKLPLNIFEPRYLRMVDDVLGGMRIIGMIQLTGAAGAGAPALYDVGCAGRITAFSETGDGRYLITLTGKQRFRITREIPADTPYRLAEVDWAPYALDCDGDNSGELIDPEALMTAARRYLDVHGVKTDWTAARKAPIEAFVVSLAMACPFESSEKQALLEAKTIFERAQRLIALMEIASVQDTGGNMLQ